jgi:predicted GNAT family N-acyltransferase
MMKPPLAHVKIMQVIISKVSWAGAENFLRAVRTPVFIEEQNVAPDFEWDELDASAVHLLAMQNNQPIACLRIIDYHKIGRMAVLKEFRRNGLGAALLLEAVQICKLHKSKVITLSAQTHAIDFYQHCGFQVTSEVYQDLHIPHVDMQMTLD